MFNIKFEVTGPIPKKFTGIGTDAIQCGTLDHYHDHTLCNYLFRWKISLMLNIWEYIFKTLDM